MLFLEMGTVWKERVMITIYDRYGQVQSWDWLVEHYGPLVVAPALSGPGWHCVELRERANIQATLRGRLSWTLGLWAWQALRRWPRAVRIAGSILPMAAATVIVTVLAANGERVGEGFEVAWYWPDAPYDSKCGPLGGPAPGMIPYRCDRPGRTNGNGDVGFAMGGGAYYEPPAIGAHAVWMYGAEENSDVVLGLGMLSFTDHFGLDVTFRWVDNEEPDPEPDPEWDEVRALLAELDVCLARMTGDIATATRLVAEAIASLDPRG